MTEGSSAYNKVAYSIDGINWNFVNLQKSYGSSICYGNGIFILYGKYYSNIAAYSNDGINWTEITLPISKTLKHIYYGDGVFIATIESTSNIVLRSTDGITWTEIYLPQSIYQPEICYGNGQFVIMDYYMNTVQCSQDGINWNAYSTQFSGSLRWLFFANNKFIAFNKGMLLYSENGNLALKGNIYADNGYFKGDITGASGTFSGRLEANEGFFGGTLEAATGSFKGDISAAYGDIGGFTIGTTQLTSKSIDANGNANIILNG